jgi:hypothetical protein
VGALREGTEPDDSWMRDAVPKDGRLRMLPSGFYQSIVGESFTNPDGVSRQSIIATTVPWSRSGATRRNETDGQFVKIVVTL